MLQETKTYDRFQHKSMLMLRRSSQPKDVDEVLFDLLSNEDDEVTISHFWTAIRSTGLRLNDPRLKECRRKFKEIEEKFSVMERSDAAVDRQTFKKCVAENLMIIVKAFKDDMVIPEFNSFASHLESICNKCKLNTSGKTSDYIPQLARASPDLWAVSICTVDGQRYSYGDCDVPFCLQSVCKPLNYALAISDIGATRVHSYVGQEPSGRGYNELTLDNHNKPHNPMINCGAIVTNTLIRPNLCMADRFDFVMQEYKRMAGNEYVGFSNPTYLSEKSSADRNFALGHFLRERKCFPSGTDLKKILEFYFQMCSIETTTESASVMAATLANGGICPITGEKVLASEAVRNTLSLMHTCGMNSYSGQFAFQVGLPAKSGIAGAVLVIVPKVMGICCYSPPLDDCKNSARGVQFCKELVNVFNFHKYDHLAKSEEKLDPRKRTGDKNAGDVVNLMFGAATGDVTALRRFALSGNDMQATDYDGRTALHVAAAEGHKDVVAMLLEQCKVEVNPKDRWGHTPYDDAVRFEQDDLAAYLKDFELKGRRLSSSSSSGAKSKDKGKPEPEKSSSGYSSRSTSPCSSEE